MCPTFQLERADSLLDKLHTMPVKPISSTKKAKDTIPCQKLCLPLTRQAVSKHVGGGWGGVGAVNQKTPRYCPAVRSRCKVVWMGRQFEGGPARPPAYVSTVRYGTKKTRGVEANI